MAAMERDILLKLERLDHLPEFLHDCVNSFPKQHASDFDKNTSSDTLWAQEELKKARTEIQSLYSRSVIEDNFSLPNDLPEKIRSALTNVYKVRQNDILYFLIKENLINNGHTLVENIDWKLKWILGSSHLANIREPVCQVTLGCSSVEKRSPAYKHVNFEANLEKIDELISLLRNVKGEMDGLN